MVASESNLVLEKAEGRKRLDEAPYAGARERDAGSRPCGWRQADWRQFLRLRFGSSQARDPVFWTYWGELVQLNTGRLVARVEGVETSRVIDAPRSPLIASTRSQSATTAEAPLASQTVLCRKLFAFWPVKEARSLSFRKSTFRKLSETTGNTAVKWCRDDDAFVLAYPYQVLTFVYEMDGSLTWVAEQGDSSGNARQLVAKVDYRPESRRYGLFPRHQAGCRSTAKLGQTSEEGADPVGEAGLLFPVHVRPFMRRRSSWTRNAFELYTFRSFARPQSFQWPGARWFRLSWDWARTLVRMDAPLSELRKGAKVIEDESPSVVTMELTKIGDCPAWAGLAVPSKCLLLLRGRRLDKEPRSNTYLSTFLRNLLEQNPLYGEPPLDLAEVGALQANKHGQAVKTNRKARR